MYFITYGKIIEMAKSKCSAFALIFHFKLSSFCWWERINIFCPRHRAPSYTTNQMAFFVLSIIFGQKVHTYKRNGLHYFSNLFFGQFVLFHIYPPVTRKRRWRYILDESAPA